MVKKKNRKLLVVSHEASYTGAPILLLHLLQLLKDELFLSFHIVIVRGGPLEKEFAALGSVTILKPEGYSNREKKWDWLYSAFKNRIQIVIVFCKALRCEAILSNSIINGKVLQWLRFSRKPIFTYVHELKSVIDTYLKQGNARASLKYSSAFFYPCKKVKEVLNYDFEVPADRLKRLNYYFPNRGNAISKAILKSKNPESVDLSVCGVGTASFRKGTDLFIDVAKSLQQKQSRFQFTWIGGFETEEVRNEYLTIVEKNKLNDTVHFPGPVLPEKVWDLYSKFDILLLTSREDPYPLVVLEAAYNRIPSVVFGDSGGITEFVENDAGWIVGDVSANEMAELLFSINKSEINERGDAAFNKAVTKHSNAQLILQQFKEVTHF